MNGPQRIERLTPLADVLARIDRLVQPVAPREARLEAAVGRVVARPIIAAGARPLGPLALRDGWAVESEDTIDAGPFAPVRLAAVRVGLGDALPPGTDAVAPIEAVITRGGATEFVVPVVPGDGVLMAGIDAGANEVLCRDGHRLRSTDVAALTAIGIEEVLVREAHVDVVPARVGDKIISAITALLAHVLFTSGANPRIIEPSTTDSLATALVAEGADGVVIVGGSGSGAEDASVRTLAGLGRVEVYGIGLAPGETTAFGFADGRPVLVLPGRMDAALAAWLTVGDGLLRRMSGAACENHSVVATLSGKIASTLGLAEVVPVRRDGGSVAPLASGYLPLQSLACADGWILVPADSEGYPSGVQVTVRPFP